MTEWIAYADLTWPEVAALPRDLPLILPLGEGYAWDKVAEALGRPARAAYLPAIPYGWRGSGLYAPEAYLGRLVANLLDSLREDGFSRVYALTPQGLVLNLGAARLTLGQRVLKDDVAAAGRAHDVAAVSQARQPSSAATLAMPADDQRGKVVLIPIGHTEQHAHHLPLCTDSVIIEAIGQGAAAAVPQQAVCLPVFPYGVSTHRASFAGTLNAGGRAFEDFWLAVVEALAARGFDRFYLLSGHGGNCSFLVNVVKYAGERWRRIFCATAWLHTAGDIGAATLARYRRSKRGGMGHAGELETALMLHLRPDLTHMERVVDEVDFIATPNYFMDWVESGALIANPPWDDDTRTGAYGAGSLATAANGARWLEAAIAEKVGHVAEIHEQHSRREARRAAGYGLWAGHS